MSDKMYRNFVYTSKQNHRVISVKSTLEFDLAFQTSEFTTHELTSESPIFLDHAFSYSYVPGEGFRKLQEPAAAEQENLALLQKKISMLQMIRINVGLVEKQVESQFHRKFAAEFPVSKENLGSLFVFLEDERTMRLQRCREFFNDVFKFVDAAQDIQSLESKFRYYTHNCLIGVYAASSRGGDADAQRD